MMENVLNFEGYLLLCPTRMTGVVVLLEDEWMWLKKKKDGDPKNRRKISEMECTGKC